MGLSGYELIILVIGTPAHLTQLTTTMASSLSLCCLHYTLISNRVSLQSPFSPATLQIHLRQGTVTTTLITPTTNRSTNQTQLVGVINCAPHCKVHIKNTSAALQHGHTDVFNFLFIPPANS